MSSGESPDAWATRLNRLRRRLQNMKKTITDEDFMIRLVTNLTPEYDSFVDANLHRLESNAANAFDYSSLLSALREKHGRLQKKAPTSNGDSALTSTNRGRPKCTICGKVGHKAENCWHRESAGDSSTKSDDTPNSNNKNPNRVCNYCGKKGHLESRCWKKKKDEKKKAEDAANTTKDECMVSSDLALISSSDLPPHIWIADSGATNHLTNSLEGMFELQDINSSISLGDATELSAVKVGKLRVLIKQLNGDSLSVVLDEVKFVPGLAYNLFSLSKIIHRKGFTVVGSSSGYHVSKGDREFTFDRTIGSSHSVLYGVEMLRSSELDRANAVMASGSKVPYTLLHDRLGHPGSDRVRSFAKSMGLSLTGPVPVCEACAKAKARQKNIPKVNDKPATQLGERLFIDLSSTKLRSKGGRTFWLLVVDEATKFCWSAFLSRKTELPDEMMKIVQVLQAKGTPVRNIRCDNASEHTIFQQKTIDAGLHITFEFTAPHTPQQNGIVERKFATLWGRVRAMHIRAGFSLERRNEMWAETARTATALENIIPPPGTAVSPFELVYGKQATYARDLRSFGEIAIILNGAEKKLKAKLKDRGTPCMFLGYSDHHASGVYRFQNLSTGKVLHSRDCVWLSKFWGEYTNNDAVIPDDDDVDDDDEVVATQNVVQPVVAPVAVQPVVAPVAAQPGVVPVVADLGVPNSDSEDLEVQAELQDILDDTFDGPETCLLYTSPSPRDS